MTRHTKKQENLPGGKRKTANRNRLRDDSDVGLVDNNFKATIINMLKNLKVTMPQ